MGTVVLDGEVAGPGPARAGGRVAAGLGRSGPGAPHDRRLRAGAGRVPGGVRARGRRSAHRQPGPRRRLFVRELAERPSRRGANVVSIDSGVGSGERHAPAAAGAGAAVLRLPDRGGRAGLQPGRPRPLHPRSAVRRRLPAWPGAAADRSCRGFPTEQQWLELLAVRRRGAGPQPGDARPGLRRGAAAGRAVLAAHR